MVHIGNGATICAAPQCTCRVFERKNGKNESAAVFIIRAFNSTVCIPGPRQLSHEKTVESAQILTLRKNKTLTVENSDQFIYIPE